MCIARACSMKENSRLWEAVRVNIVIQVTSSLQEYKIWIKKWINAHVILQSSEKVWREPEIHEVAEMKVQ